jgi:hypothetical protein
MPRTPCRPARVFNFQGCLWFRLRRLCLAPRSRTLVPQAVFQPAQACLESWYRRRNRRIHPARSLQNLIGK